MSKPFHSGGLGLPVPCIPCRVAVVALYVFVHLRLGGRAKGET